MRIVNVMLGRGLGGIEQAIVDYCEALKLAGHEPVAIVHPDACILPKLEALHIGVHTLANFGAWDPIAVLRLKGMLARLCPDACIAHGNRALSLLRLARAPRLTGVMHNYKIKCERLRYVFCPTQDLLREVQKKGAPDVQAFHLPNMVRVPPVMPTRTPHAPPVIGAMGRFVAKKGFALFIESLALLKSQGLPFRAVLAGGGEDEQTLKDISQANGLGDRLHFAGWVEDKQAFFGSIDLFCLPSHHEPFGIVLLEAMAQGLPVAATMSEGPSEILAARDCGMLVPKDDAAALAGALAGLLAEPERAAALGQKAYEAAKNRYDLTVLAGKLDLALRAVCRL